jgi:TrmH family RNA methyltransferase
MQKFDITSNQNPQVKYAVRLREDKRLRLIDRRIIVEGWEEIEIASTSGVKPITLYTAPEIIKTGTKIHSASEQVFTVTRNVFNKLSYRENPDGWLAVFEMPNRHLTDLVLAKKPLVLVVEGIEKPGNLGAIIRTADAAGVNSILVTNPKVDLWNPNVIRASRGAVFSLPVVPTDNSHCLEWINAKQIRLVGASPGATHLYTEVDYLNPTAFVVGTEDLGLTNFWLEHADVVVQIPMVGKVNSLNVSVASALLIYEAKRQRSLTPSDEGF